MGLFLAALCAMFLITTPKTLDPFLIQTQDNKLHPLHAQTLVAIKTSFHLDSNQARYRIRVTNQKEQPVSFKMVTAIPNAQPLKNGQGLKLSFPSLTLSKPLNLCVKGSIHRAIGWTENLVLNKPMDNTDVLWLSRADRSLKPEVFEAMDRIRRQGGLVLLSLPDQSFLDLLDAVSTRNELRPLAEALPFWKELYKLSYGDFKRNRWEIYVHRMGVQKEAFTTKDLEAAIPLLVEGPFGKARILVDLGCEEGAVYPLERLAWIRGIPLDPGEPRKILGVAAQDPKAKIIKWNYLFPEQQEAQTALMVPVSLEPRETKELVYQLSWPVSHTLELKPFDGSDLQFGGILKNLLGRWRPK